MNYKTFIYSIFTLTVSLLFIDCQNKMNSNQEIDSIEEMSEKPTKFLFSGSYTKKEGHVDGKAEGIGVHSVSVTGELKKLSVDKGIINPSYLAIASNGQYLYAVSETGSDVDTTGSVAAYKIDQVSGNLTQLNSQSSHAFAPCYISVDNQNRMAFVTNYVGGVVAIYPIDAGGALKEASQIIRLEGNGLNKSKMLTLRLTCKWACNTKLILIR